MKKIILLLSLIISSSAYSYEFGLGMEGGQMMNAPVMGFWGSIGPVLLGYKLSLTGNIDTDRKESNLSYGRNGYLNQKNKGEPMVSSFNLNYDILSFFYKDIPLKVYAGFYTAKSKTCPVYWTSEIDYFYRCEKWENENKSGLDFRVHYDFYKKENWSIPFTLAFNDTGFLLGLGYNMMFK